MTTPTTPDVRAEALALPRMTPGIYAGELTMFPSENGKYVRLSDAESSLKARDAEIEWMRGEVADLRAHNPWKDAIDEALIVNCLDCIGPDDEPESTLSRLIGWEVSVALDPAVSQAAADLVASRFTEKQCIDLFAAALYVGARGDETSVLSEENAERIAAFLCDLAGVDLDAAIDQARATGGEKAK